MYIWSTSTVSYTVIRTYHRRYSSITHMLMFMFDESDAAHGANDIIRERRCTGPFQQYVHLVRWFILLLLSFYLRAQYRISIVGTVYHTIYQYVLLILIETRQYLQLVDRVSKLLSLPHYLVLEVLVEYVWSD